MNFGNFEISGNKVIMRINNRICETKDELLTSKLFLYILKLCIKELKKHDSYLLHIFNQNKITDKDIKILTRTFLFLTKMNSELIPNVVKGSEAFFKDKTLLNDFVDYVYNYWRNFNRFIICESHYEEQETRPYRIFNQTIEQLTHLVRATYRDIQENIIGTHPRIYRQVHAGAEVAVTAVTQNIRYKTPAYQDLKNIPIIRQILLNPPLILNPPMNKRAGRFENVTTNPINKLKLCHEDWLCYPAKVGNLIIFIYFHKNFSELGYSLCNLFDLAEDTEIQKKPDAVYFFGVPRQQIEGLGESLTIFHEDTKENIFVAAVPNDECFGYFGYLKKMVLTLHNSIMIKRKILPFHGALLNIMLPQNKSIGILLIGDTGAGKSETIEALRDLGKDEIQDMIIVADDMGSIAISPDGPVLGYGTEIGAFLRLDDLKSGYAFGQIDRAIIMSPNKTNARIVIPITPFDRVIQGQPIDYIFYANNYDEIDKEHPIVERFKTHEQALDVFREGTVMSKGTTTTSGLVHSYFANIFGPPQYREDHDKIAVKYFKKFFEKKIFVGQIRTRLGIPGYERKGPEEAAKELLNTIHKQIQTPSSKK